MQHLYRSKLRFLLRLTAILAGGLLVPLAKADLVTYKIAFTTSGGVVASGSYTLTIDPTVTYIGQSQGLTVDSFTDGFPVPKTSVFTYQAAGGQLEIGGAPLGVSVDYNTDDYLLLIGHFPTDPAFYQLTLSTSAPFYILQTNTGRVTVTQIAATPEPSTLSLLGTGVLGAAGVVRKRWA